MNAILFPCIFIHIVISASPSLLIFLAKISSHFLTIRWVVYRPYCDYVRLYQKCYLCYIFFQAVIDANIFPVLIEILSKAEFKTRKEAAWAITNATSGGTPDQIRYLVNQNCIGPLCDLLTVMDTKIVQVALNGLENILRLGEQDAKLQNGTNPYAVLIEECYGKRFNSDYSSQKLLNIRNNLYNESIFRNILNIFRFIQTFF